MIRRFLNHLLGPLHRRRALREADAELQFHIELETEANRARGLSPEDARQAALREFGGVTQAREGVRRARTTWIEGLWQDARYSVRTLRRTPAFTITAVLILGLGIGATTAAYSIVNAVFFKPLAVPEADRLVFVYQLTTRGQRHAMWGMESTQFFEGRYDKAFSGVAGHTQRWTTIAADGLDASVQRRGEAVTANYFDVVGVEAAMGRTFGPQEDDPANPDLAIIISHDLWTRDFKGAPGILGRKLRLADRVFSVIGVMGPGFDGLSDAWNPSRFWIPIAQTDPPPAGTTLHMGTIARLRPDATLEEAHTIVNVQGAQLQIEAMRATPPRNWKPSQLVVVPSTDVQNPFYPDEWLIPPQILAAVGIVVVMVLLIAVTNIAGVLSARGVSRAQEVAVRQALGAGTPQLVRQLLTESVIVAIAGGAFGLVLAQWIVDGYQAFTPTRFFIDVPFDARVALFTLALCIGAGILVGIAPAIQARRVNVLAALAGGVGSGGSRRVKRRLRHAILIPQVALSTVLLLVAGVHVRTLSAIERADLGYRTEDVITLRAQEAAPSSGYSPAARATRGERNRALYLALHERVSGVTGASVAIASAPHPLNFTMPGRFTSQTGYIAGSPDKASAYAMRISPNYFATMGMPLLEGRDFDARDSMTTPHVAIISRTLARQLFPAGNALGQSISWHYGGNEKQPWWLEVVGIVGETAPVLRDQVEHPMVYLNFSQTWEPYVFYVVATSPDDSVALIQRLKTAVVSAAEFAEVRDVRSMAQIIGEILYPRRAAVIVLLACGIVGLVLAAAGIYGVISHSVAQRMQEIGIRTTLGAGRGAILALVFREALFVTAAGVLPGLALGFTALRMTANIVGPMPTFDVATFIVVPLVTMAVILAALYGPARRAARMDPSSVLRAGY